MTGLLLAACAQQALAAAPGPSVSGPSVSGPSVIRPFIKIKLKPPSPNFAAYYHLYLSGTAPAGGTLGKNGKQTEIDILEQIAGRCARTPAAELKHSSAENLEGPLFVNKGRFRFGQKRQATSAVNLKIRFCAYLSTSANKVVARATATYTSP